MMKKRELAQKNAITVFKTYVGKTKLVISKKLLCKIAYFPAQCLLNSVSGVGSLGSWVAWVKF